MFETDSFECFLCEIWQSKVFTLNFKAPQLQSENGRAQPTKTWIILLAIKMLLYVADS